jgi:hypothetical protein
MLKVISLASLVLLAGCSTPYQEMGLLGGVSAARIDEHTAQIRAQGNGYTAAATVEMFVMLKSAEETMKGWIRRLSDRRRSRRHQRGIHPRLCRRFWHHHRLYASHGHSHARWRGHHRDAEQDRPVVGTAAHLRGGRRGEVSRSVFEEGAVAS